MRKEQRDDFISFHFSLPHTFFETTAVLRRHQHDYAVRNAVDQKHSGHAEAFNSILYRLDRLLLLLSTGSTPLVRQTAAQQLGTVAGQRIQRGTAASSSASTSVYRGLDGEWAEVVNLLVKVLPYTRSKVWETRIAAALAIECIVKAVGIWEPPDSLGLDPEPSTLKNNSSDGVVEETSHPLTTFDLTYILFEGTKLLASSGNEYARGEKASSSARSDVVKSLGLSLPGAGDTELGIDVEKELQDGENDQGHESKVADVKGKGRMMPSTASTEEDEYKGLSARERNALKRKRKQSGGGSGAGSSTHSSPAPSSALGTPSTKVRIVSQIGSPATDGERRDVAVPVSVKKEETEDVEVGTPEPVTISYRWPKGGQVQAKTEEGTSADEAGDDSTENRWLPTPDRWPFTLVVEALQNDLLSSSWEVRHGSSLALREILKVQGRSGGLISGSARSVNQIAHQQWCEDLSFTILQVFALDRFGDFVGDQVVAPVRETASQTLSALLLYMPKDSTKRIMDILLRMISQEDVKQKLSEQGESGRKNYYWEVKHAGLLGLKYLVAVKSDLFDYSDPDGMERNSSTLQEGKESISVEQNLLKRILGAVLEGLVMHIMPTTTLLGTLMRFNLSALTAFGILMTTYAEWPPRPFCLSHLPSFHIFRKTTLPSYLTYFVFASKISRTISLARSPT